MDRSTGDKGGEVKKSNFNGAGLFFVTAHIDGSAVSCLIDTGATLSLMSTQTWNLNRGKCSELNSFDKDIIAACGTPLTIKGQTTVDLRINGKTYPIKTVIADIDGEIMLGLDFFKQYQCHIDLASAQILINGDRCSIKSKGASGCADSTPAS
ncbi:hypothetical protein DPMN_075269 [Dreissena polymorpha]|uniref:Aspartic peptidase DDI1-type domain-containing protein n=1 Tax=Dreissena polymorpha TaxID=45954 RepID=A0A9D4BLD8_DREPO|nr:hypothetical protein DPMN_075269 [Dreissena polymorpha]